MNRFVAYVAFMILVSVQPAVADIQNRAKPAAEDRALSLIRERFALLVAQQRLEVGLRESNVKGEGDQASGQSSQTFVAPATAGDKTLLTSLEGEISALKTLVDDVAGGKARIQDCQIGNALDTSANAYKTALNNASVGTQNTATIVAGLIPVLYFNCDFGKKKAAAPPISASKTSRPWAPLARTLSSL